MWKTSKKENANLIASAFNAGAFLLNGSTDFNFFRFFVGILLWRPMIPDEALLQAEKWSSKY